MLYTHLLHPLALQDIIEAYDWYESSKTGLGEEFAATIKKIIDEIIRHPQTYISKYNVSYREAIIKKFPYVIIPNCTIKFALNYNVTRNKAVYGNA